MSAFRQFIILGLCYLNVRYISHELDHSISKYQSIVSHINSDCLSNYITYANNISNSAFNDTSKTKLQSYMDRCGKMSLAKDVLYLKFVKSIVDWIEFAVRISSCALLVIYTFIQLLLRMYRIDDDPVLMDEM